MTGDAGAAPNKALRRKLLLGLAALVAATFLAMLLPARQEPPLPPLPNPNGYDDFLKAALLVSNDVYSAPMLAHAELRALVISNAQALTLVRLGLSLACSVHTDSAVTNLSGQLTELSELKTLALVLGEEGRLAEMEKRNADAARSYLDAIRLGNEASRGGMIAHLLSGIAIEKYGWVPLARLAPGLNCQESRSIIDQLEKVDDSTVSWEEIVRNDHRFDQYYTAHARWSNPLAWIVLRWENWRTDRKVLRLHKSTAAHLRLLITELALRCYKSSRGQPPARLDDLVPDYLAKVPQDPFSRRALVYRPKGKTWQLYSVGPDGVDDGGRPFVTSSQKGDILFDSP